MAGLEDMVAWAERSLGTDGRPNTITRWYAKRNGHYFASAPWCNQGVTYWAHHSGNMAAVCFGRDYAYTVWHAERFMKEGQWHVDVAGIRRGDIVFFDWGETNRVGAIDHIGLVTGVKGDVIYTIEGNTGDACRRRARYASTIVGYGRPDYGGGGQRTTGGKRTDEAPPGRPMLKKGSAGVLVAQLQRCLNKVLRAGLEVDGEFGPRTVLALKAFQRKAGGLLADGEYGPKTAGKLKVARKRMR